jgi:antitoxin HicB
MVSMAAQQRLSLDEYLAVEYPMSVIAEPNGGYVAMFPDLPGCFAQADNLTRLMELATDARVAWISGELEDGHDIPPPTYPEEYSGKFNLRVPRFLHRRLAESAEREGVSLNQYVVGLLSEQDALARVERRLEALEARSAPEPETESQPQPQPELATATT